MTWNDLARKKFVDIWKVIYLILLFMLSFAGNAKSAEKLKVYVWDFATCDKQKDDFTKRLTMGFEEALFQEKCCIILDRSNHDRLVAHQDNEKGAVLDMKEVSPSSLKNFTTEGANAFIFGEVCDAGNDQVEISVTVEKFSGRKLSIESIRLAKNDDSESRENKIRELASKTCSSLKKPPIWPTVLGLGAVIGVGTGIVIATSSSGDDNDTPETLSGTFVKEGAVLEASTGGFYKCMQRLNLSQNGNSLTGNYQKTCEFYNCCIANITVDITGTFDGFTGTLSWGPGRSICQCHNSGQTYEIEEEGGTYQFESVNTGERLDIQGRDTFIRQN